eukprot:182435_1
MIREKGDSMEKENVYINKLHRMIIMLQSHNNNPNSYQQNPTSYQQYSNTYQQNPNSYQNPNTYQQYPNSHQQNSNSYQQYPVNNRSQHHRISHNENILSPRNICYTQQSIRATWSDKSRHKGKTIKWTLDQLQKRIITVDNIPKIKLVYHNEKFYSLDNRRLWVFKQFGQDITCKIVQVDKSLWSGRGFYGLSIKVRRQHI